MHTFVQYNYTLIVAAKLRRWCGAAAAVARHGVPVVRTYDMPAFYNDLFLAY